jgi:hypothetical protein
MAARTASYSDAPAEQLTGGGLVGFQIRTTGSPAREFIKFLTSPAAAVINATGMEPGGS